MTGALEPTTSPFDAIRHEDERGEWWSARDLAPQMDYSRWEKFAEVVEKAKASLALVEGAEQAEHHFTAWGSDGGRWGNQRLDDCRMTRFGAYLTAMAGDDTKGAVARARIYFATKTREAEAAPRPHAEVTRADLARMVLEEETEKLAAIERAETAEAERDIFAPDARAWQTLASADGDLAVADAAKILTRDPAIKVGRDRLFTILHQRGWIYRQRGDGRWRVVQAKAIDTGRLSELPSSHYHPRTGELVLDAPQIRVILKGLRELHQILGGTAPLRVERQLALGTGGAA